MLTMVGSGLWMARAAWSLRRPLTGEPVGDALVPLH
jgi:hypothetical protein